MCTNGSQVAQVKPGSEIASNQFCGRSYNPGPPSPVYAYKQTGLTSKDDCAHVQLRYGYKWFGFNEFDKTCTYFNVEPNAVQAVTMPNSIQERSVGRRLLPRPVLVAPNKQWAAECFAEVDPCATPSPTPEPTPTPDPELRCEEGLQSIAGYPHHADSTSRATSLEECSRDTSTW